MVKILGLRRQKRIGGNWSDPISGKRFVNYNQVSNNIATNNYTNEKKGVKTRCGMRVTTFEGIIEDGQIKLTTDVNLPEKTKVYVVVPGFEDKRVFHVYSPRLAHPEQVNDFEIELVEDKSSAEL